MFLARLLLRVAPAPIRALLLRHAEVLKFLTVGGMCFMITITVNYALKLTILTAKPLTALTVATLISTMVSYVLNREWSFRTRGGRVRHHEAALFFIISGLGIALYLVPPSISRYVLELRTPIVSRPMQEIADFVSIILGTLLAMVFRLWAFKRFVFPHADVRPAVRVRTSARRGRRGGRAVTRSVVIHDQPVPRGTDTRSG